MKDLLTSEHPTLFTDKPKEKLSRRTIEHLVSTALVRRDSQFGLEQVVDRATVYYEVRYEDATEMTPLLVTMRPYH